MRKPKSFKVDGCDVVRVDDREESFYPIVVGGSLMKITPAEARRLSHWLIKAAEWAEVRKKK